MVIELGATGNLANRMAPSLTRWWCASTEALHDVSTHASEFMIAHSPEYLHPFAEQYLVKLYLCILS